jgi:hypothetical protein
MARRSRRRPSDREEIEDAAASLWKALHARVLAGDALAREEMCRRALPDLRQEVRSKVPWAQPESIDSGIDDALLKYLANPGRYDPDRGKLMAWLTTVAVNRTRDIERHWRYVDAHEIGIEPGNLATMAGAAMLNPGTAAEALRAKRRRRFLSLVPDDSDRRFAALHLDRAPLEVQATALRVAELSVREQRDAVNRAWERIFTSAKREWRRRGEGS